MFDTGDTHSVGIRDTLHDTLRLSERIIDMPLGVNRERCNLCISLAAHFYKARHIDRYIVLPLGVTADIVLNAEDDIACVTAIPASGHVAVGVHAVGTGGISGTATITAHCLNIAITYDAENKVINVNSHLVVDAVKTGAAHTTQIDEVGGGTRHS